jgi:pimeloyl-ACP methyl ester carboxylesterase
MTVEHIIGEELGERRRVQLTGGPISYRERGSGPPVVFVHGLLTNALLWRKVLPGLAGSFRCIAPDWPLGSHSEPMDAATDLSPPGLAGLIADFLDELGLRDATIVANDTGGALVQILAASRPDRIGRLVLTPSDSFERFFPPLFRPLQWAGHLPGCGLVIGRILGVRALRRSPLAYGLLIKGSLDHEVIDAWAAPLRASAGVRRDLAKVLRGIDSRHTLAAAERLRDFEQPVLLAWAREDRLFPISLAHRLAQVLPDARVEEIGDSYTFIPEDQPDALVELIDSFVSATALSSASP